MKKLLPTALHNCKFFVQIEGTSSLLTIHISEETEQVFNLAIEIISGSGPTIKFEDKSREIKDFNCPIPQGIIPVSMFPFKYKCSKVPISFILEGITSEK